VAPASEIAEREHQHAAHVLAENSTGFEIFDNDRETKSIVACADRRLSKGAETRSPTPFRLTQAASVDCLFHLINRGLRSQGIS
jgi:hypothetical protein